MWRGNLFQRNNQKWILKGKTHIQILFARFSLNTLPFGHFLLKNGYLMNQFHSEIILREVAKVCFPFQNLSYTVVVNKMMWIQDNSIALIVFTCSKSAIETLEKARNMLKLKNRGTRTTYMNVILASLLLTLNKFHRFF